MDPAATLTALSGIDVTNFKDGIGKADTHKTIFENAQKYGIDCLFHLEWVHSGTKRLLTDGPRPTIGENHPPDPTTPHYDLAVSIPDMGIMEPTFYAVTLGGKKYEQVLPELITIFDDALDEMKEQIVKVGAKIYEYEVFSRAPLASGSAQAHLMHSSSLDVPFGMFRPHFYRDSMAYMGNYATFGYYGSMNIMKLLDNKGGYTKAGYQHPVLWTGTYAMSKLNWQYRCLNSAKANNTDARLVAKGTRPLSPGFRVRTCSAFARFRRHIFLTLIVICKDGRMC
ncbi:hypothetical protein V5799_019073, partial [Amblyomma americanum]